MSAPELGQEISVRQRPGILFRELEGEAILLDPQAGTYFGLNEVGTRAWVLLGGGAALGRVHEALLAEFEATPEQVWGDLVALVRDLLAHGLLEIAGPPDSV